jgi:hypothetical protein
LLHNNGSYFNKHVFLVDPSKLTAILPTTANGLRVPKMYYFQNDTSGAVSNINFN